MAEAAQRRRIKRKVKRRVHRDLPAGLLRVLGGLAVVGLGALFWFGTESARQPEFAGRRALTLNEQLFDVVPNTWAKVRVGTVGAWYGEGHAGAVFDTRRRKIFVFGSGFDGKSWDNAVHEFDPSILQWSNHEPPAPRSTYRTDKEGHPISGDRALQPWAMQVFGGLAYDPSLDALVLAATPRGNPALRRVHREVRDPVWLYELAARQWRAMDLPEGKAVASDGSAIAYDMKRDTLVVYNRAGVWEMGPDRKAWHLATTESHHESHPKLVFDPRRGDFLVFGGLGGNKIWVYTPGAEAGQAGSWAERVPGGDQCPFDEDPAVAFDPDDDLVLLVLENTLSPNEQAERLARKGAPAQQKEASSPADQGSKSAKDDGEGQRVTCVYDPAANAFVRLPLAVPPTAGHPHTLLYDPIFKVFFLMGKDADGGPSVWVMSLAPDLFKTQPIPNAVEKG